MTHDLKTKDGFTAAVEEIKSTPGYIAPRAFAMGIAHINRKGEYLDAFFPMVNYQENYGTAAVVSKVVGRTNGTGTFLLGAGADDFQDQGNTRLLRFLRERRQEPFEYRTAQETSDLQLPSRPRPGHRRFHRRRRR